MLWIAVGGLLAVLLLSYTFLTTWERRIRIAGMFLQLMGLLTVAWGLQETRKLFHLPSLLQQARNLLHLPSFYQENRIAALTGSAQAAGAVSSFGTVKSSVSASLEDRVAMLEENLNQTNLAIQQAQMRMDEEAQKQADNLALERKDRETVDTQTQQLLQEAIAGGLHVETMGVFWLLVGVTLASASAEISRWIPGT